jgi:hypothetical protein
MKIITCTAGAFALVLAACGGYTPIGEGEPTGGTSGTGGSSMMGGTGGTSTMTGGSGGTATMTGGTGGTATMTGGTSAMTGGTGGTSTMTGGTGGTGMYDPCANRACGTTCSVCDPNDMTCVADAVITYCDAEGQCTASFPMCETNQCETTMDCPILDIACPTCPDGSNACPTTDCVNGQCITSYPTCPGQMCMTAEQCPVSDAPCVMCADGRTVCPWSDCVNGVCTSGIDSCNDVSPCDGKACGEPCSPCSGSACAAPIMAASYCNENEECVFNVPMCTTAECKVDMDCLAPDICMACPETGDCATMKCVNGGCQWQCEGTDECGGCGHEEVCVYQVGGPGPSVGYTCATIGTCEDASNYCPCVEGQGMCQQSMSDKYCQCDNGID